MIKDMVIEIFGGAWPMIIIFTVILSSIRLTYLIIKKEKFILYKELTYLLFVIYLLSLFYIVTFQDDNYGTFNLIPFNPWPGCSFAPSSNNRVHAFARELEKAGFAAPVRVARGQDILAACGQLKSKKDAETKQDPK